MLEDVFKDRASPGARPAPAPKRKSPLLAPAVLLPFLLLLLLGSIVALFGLLSFDRRTPADLLDEIRASSGEKRALAAYELSRLESYPLGAEARTPLVTLVVQAFLGEAGRDSRVRRSLALTLGRLGDPAAVPALIASLEDADPETQIYSLWALGAIGDRTAVEPVLSRLQQEDAGIRKTAAFSLGQLGDPRAAPALRVALQDPAPDVAWNAAIALARLGDSAALPTLLPLLEDPGATADLSPSRREDLKVNILRSLHRLSRGPARAALERLARSDPSTHIRSEARMALAGRGPASSSPSAPER